AVAAHFADEGLEVFFSHHAPPHCSIAGAGWSSSRAGLAAKRAGRPRSVARRLEDGQWQRWAAPAVQRRAPSSVGLLAEKRLRLVLPPGVPAKYHLVRQP